ncbi:MAG: hypothetical protein ABIQ39_06820 [Ilumatobacteraceae bacterium]
MTETSRRQQLLRVELAALAADSGALGAHSMPGEFAIGSALMAGNEAWILVDDDPARGLGPAVAWAIRHRAIGLQLLAHTATGTLARRAASFGFPVDVWHIEGRTLIQAVPEPLSIPQLEFVGTQLTDVDEFRAVIAAGGATPVIEHGVLTGEVEGLEVCRVVVDESSGLARLEVGVGAHDRETYRMLHGEHADAQSLAGVVAAVAPHRRRGAPIHPLNQLARSRALRAALIADPALIGATNVEPCQPPVPRRNVKDDVPCVAVAVVDGEPTTVVCSVGVDLDVVPYACDARSYSEVRPCIVAVPVGSDLPIQRELAASLVDPIRFVVVDTLRDPTA